MIKILFFIRDLGQGGAEKVLVNLVNNMDPRIFDISVTVLFGGGVNEQFLKPHIKFRAVCAKSFPGSTKIMKLFTPAFLHKLAVKEQYDIEVSYLEGPSARVISGCDKTKGTKLVSWIHVEQHTIQKVARSFRSYAEAKRCYGCFDRFVGVSEYVKKDFQELMKVGVPMQVLYNTVESDDIKKKALEPTNRMNHKDAIQLIAIGTLKESKGYNRLLKIMKRLRDEEANVHLYILGIGPQEEELKAYIRENRLDNHVTLLGYDTNPYKYLSQADLFVCSSYAEGFSTAATESLIVGTPVCTVEVAGMKEMLGEHNEYGIVTENSEEGLYHGIKELIDDSSLRAYYKQKAIERSSMFVTTATVSRVEAFFMELGKL